MLDSIKHIIRARKSDDRGFSLVELAVVIVIIGILVAVAIPVFLNMQSSAENAARETAVANGAAMFAAEIAGAPNGTLDDTARAALETRINEDVAPDHNVTLSGTTLNDYCVTSQDVESMQKGACA